MQQFVCIACGVEWQREAVRGRVPRFCPRCRPMAARYRYQPDLRCVACGDPVRRTDCYYCSKSCAGRHRDSAKWPVCAVPVAHPSRKLWPERGPATRVFITDCAICNATFVTRYTISTCSAACKEAKRRAARSERGHRRRALQRGAFVQPVYRRRIYERDKWRCNICGKRVSKTAVVPHPRAATLDHLVPLATGGSHEPANVATAHFMCNAIKGDRGGDEQLMLVG